jgi:uncharacterized membrane protein
VNDQHPPQYPPPPPSGTPPPPPPLTPSSTGQPTSTGLDPKLAGLLCYILGIVTGLIFFFIEKTNQIVRFHAAQSIVFSAFTIVLWIVLTIISLVLYQISWALGNIFNLVTLLLWLGLFIVWIVLLVKGYSGEKWKLPVIGDLAERMAGKTI